MYCVTNLLGFMTEEIRKEFLRAAKTRRERETTGITFYIVSPALKIYEAAVTSIMEVKYINMQSTSFCSEQ